MKEHFRQIFAGFTGAVSLFVMFYFTGLSLWFSILIAALLGLGTYFTIPRRKNDDEIEAAPGITRKQLNDALEHVDGYINKFVVEEQKCAIPGMRKTIGDIRKTLEKIKHNFERDPQDLNLAHQFLTQYLEKSFLVISQYNRLSAMTADGPLRQQLENVEKSIHLINSGFEGFYRKCLENDIYDLAVESETLNAIIEMDQPFLEVDERSHK